MAEKTKKTKTSSSSNSKKKTTIKTPTKKIIKKTSTTRTSTKKKLAKSTKKQAPRKLIKKTPVKKTTKKKETLNLTKTTDVNSSSFAKITKKLLEKLKNNTTESKQVKTTKKKPTTKKVKTTTKRIKATVKKAKKTKSAIPLTQKVKKCKKSTCKEPAVIEGYCRYHYIAYWKAEHIDKKIKNLKELEKMITNLANRFSEKYIDMMIHDLSDEELFVDALSDMGLEDEYYKEAPDIESQEIIESYKKLIDHDEK